MGRRLIALPRAWALAALLVLLGGLGGWLLAPRPRGLSPSPLPTLSPDTALPRKPQAAPQGYRQAFEAALQARDAARARQWAVRALEADLPDETLRAMAQQAWRSGAWEAARVLYQALAERHPREAEVVWPLALLEAAERPERALTWVEGLARQEGHPYQRPARILEAALRRALVHEDPAYRLVEAGRGLAAVGQWDLAYRAWRGAVEQQPGYAVAWAYLGEAAARLEEPEVAYQAWAMVRRLAPDEPLGYFFPGWYALRRDAPGQALGWLRRAVALRPQEPVFRFHLARALARHAGFFPQAWEQTLYLAHHPAADPRGLKLAARFALEHQVYVESHALPWLRRVLLQNPQDAEALRLMGWAYMEREEPELALRFLWRAWEQAPDDPEVHRLLAIWYRWQGDEAQARFHEAQARDLETPTLP